MDFTEDEDHAAIAEAVRGLCARFDDDYWSRCDREHRFRWEFYAQRAAGGWVGFALP
jgi:acyl-CoA dehydrogenase